MKKRNTKKPVQNEIRRIYEDAHPRPMGKTVDVEPAPLTIDTSGDTPKFSWLSPDDQQHFDMWTFLWDKRGRFEGWHAAQLAAYCTYIEWFLEREILHLEMTAHFSEEERKERREAREVQVAQALARGPLRRKIEKSVLIEVHAKEWRAQAKDAWNVQLEARRKAETTRALDTYAEMAREIQRNHTGKPRPTVTTIRQAITGLRPTLSGGARKNANPKKRSE